VDLNLDDRSVRFLKADLFPLKDFEVTVFFCIRNLIL
jgi:hypothetical protein